MLPITQVIVYKHGVAYYQRQGTVNGNTVIELSFKAEQMNDVLKSLTTLDWDGGSFSAVSYDSEESAERRLSALNIQVPKGAAITDFLDQLKGVHTTVTTPTEVFDGAIIGIEHLASLSLSQSGGNTSAAKLPHLALLGSDMSMRQVALQSIQNIRFTDDNIQRELSSLMETHAGIARNEKKRLSIQTQGENERKISVSYVVEAPVWKTSYRMVIGESTAKEQLLQGWSIVDNTSEEDWEDVRLTLVSGLPISFRHDLYTPRYQQRPEIQVSREAAVAPPVVEGAFAASASIADELDFLDASPAPLMNSAPVGMALQKTRSKKVADAMGSSTPVETRTEELGDLFSYEIAQPVSIKRGQSALVPILQANIDAEKVLYFNESIRHKNPMSSFRIKNNTQLTLEGGPITVYEGENYLGEAMLDTLRKQDEKIVPYSVDLSVVVEKQVSSNDQSYTNITKMGHYIYKHKKREIITEYVFNKSSEQEDTLFLDHAFTHKLPHEAEQHKPKELIEITENFWRYQVSLVGKGQSSFKVVEVEYTYDAITIPNVSHYEISTLKSQKLIDGALADELQKIADLCEQQAKLQNERQLNENRRAEILNGQDRLRASIQALGNSAEEAKLRARYITKLNQEEDILEAAAKQIETLDEEIEKMIDKINSAADALNVEGGN